MKILPEHKTLQKCLTLQQGQSDCGVACLLSIINYYGGSNSLENLRKITGTNITGTTLLGLYQAANQIGFRAEGCESDLKGLIEYGKPCILHVVIDDKLEHYVVCFGTIEKNSPGEKESMLIIGDPAHGITYLTKNELEKIWKSKTCLTLEPNKYFTKATIVKKEKRKWDYRIS